MECPIYIRWHRFIHFELAKLIRSLRIFRKKEIYHKGNNIDNLNYHTRKGMSQFKNF